MYYLIIVLFLLMANEIILPYQYSAIGGRAGSCGGDVRGNATETNDYFACMFGQPLPIVVS